MPDPKKLQPEDDEFTLDDFSAAQRAEEEVDEEELFSEAQAAEDLAIAKEAADPNRPGTAGNPAPPSGEAYPMAPAEAEALNPTWDGQSVSGVRPAPAAPVDPPGEEGMISRFFRDKAQTLRARTAGALGYGTYSFADELAGLVAAPRDWSRAIQGQAMAQPGDSVTPVPDVMDAYRARRDDYRSADAALQESNPYDYHVTGMATSMMMPGPKVKPGLMGAITSGARTGAISGLGRSNAELTDPTAADLVQAGEDVAFGQAGGALAGGAGYGVGRAAGWAAPKIAGFSDWLARKAEERAVKSTGATKVDLKPLFKRDPTGEAVRDKGRVLLEEDLIKPFANVSETAERIAEARDPAAQAVGAILKQVDDAGGSFNFKQFLDRAEADIVAKYAKDPAVANEVAAIKHFIDEYRALYPSGQIPLREANLLKSSFQKAKINFGNHWNNNGPSQYLEQFKKQFQGLWNDEIEGQLEAQADPIVRAQFENAKRRLGAIDWAQQVSGRGAAGELGNNMLSQQDAAAAQMAASIAKQPGQSMTIGAMAGAGLAGFSKFLRERGSSAAAVGADRASQSNLLPRIVASNPETLGKYGATLADAFSRGGEGGLALQDFMLGNTDPEYAELRRRLPSLVTGEAPRE